MKLQRVAQILQLLKMLVLNVPHFVPMLIERGIFYANFKLPMNKIKNLKMYSFI